MILSKRNTVLIVRILVSIIPYIRTRISSSMILNDNDVQSDDILDSKITIVRYRRHVHRL